MAQLSKLESYTPKVFCTVRKSRKSRLEFISWSDINVKSFEMPFAFKIENIRDFYFVCTKDTQLFN